MSGAQAGFGFAPSLADPRRDSKIARIAHAGLFWMVEAGAGWSPLCSAVESLDEARRLAARRFAASLVRVVEATEVGR